MIVGQDEVVEAGALGRSSPAATCCSRATPGSARRCSCERWRAASSSGSRASSSRPISCRATSRAPTCSCSAPTALRRAASSSTAGPIFGQVVLADEINRATPKTQSALLEAMQEHAVHDRRHAARARRAVLRARHRESDRDGGHLSAARGAARSLPAQGAGADPGRGRADRDPRAHDRASDAGARRACSTRDEVLALRALCRDVAVAEPVLRYAARLVGASAPDDAAARPLASSARCATAPACAARSRSCSRPRRSRCSTAALTSSFADVQRTARPVLRHRLLRSFEGEADGITTDQIVDELVASVPARPEAVERAAQGQ